MPAPVGGEAGAPIWQSGAEPLASVLIAAVPANGFDVVGRTRPENREHVRCERCHPGVGPQFEGEISAALPTTRYPKFSSVRSSGGKTSTTARESPTTSPSWSKLYP